MGLFAKRLYLFKQILPFGVIWTVLGMLFLATDYLALGDQANAQVTAVKLTPSVVVFALFGVFVFGVIFGFIEVFWLENIFKKKSFSTKVFAKFLLYLLFFQVFMLIGYPIAASLEMGSSVLDKVVWDRYLEFLSSDTHLSATLQLGFSTLVSLLYVEISNYVGQNVLNNFFTGKYHRPVEEDRIFMFVDMKDSTTIAEQLGHRAYFDFLQAYYDCFSGSIINHQGEVYQYVGDEIVISWKLDKGIANDNAIACFFSMKSAMRAANSLFEKRFGIIPDFKAAVHYGNITTGEIGALKKDIFFTGDVLNTTARILSKSSEYQEDLLISEDLSKLFSWNVKYKLKTLGTQELKGKKNQVLIYAVHEC